MSDVLEAPSEPGDEIDEGAAGADADEPTASRRKPVLAILSAILGAFVLLVAGIAIGLALASDDDDELLARADVEEDGPPVDAEGADESAPAPEEEAEPEAEAEEFDEPEVDSADGVAAGQVVPNGFGVPVLAPDSEPTSEAYTLTFDGDVGLDELTVGVHHREEPFATSWTGDHDLDCGTPDTQRPLSVSDPDGTVYLCRDHMMTSMGDVSPYSIVWVAVNQTFTDQTSVSWDVNSTFLGKRQWWEVALMPVGFDSGVPTCPYCSVASGLNPSPSLLPAYPDDALVVANGPFGGDPPTVNDEPLTEQNLCGEFALDPEGCGSKPIRQTWTVTDNGDGTVTVDFLDNSWTVPGSFPENFRVVLKDHNYTPDKDEIPVGHTWHWDNILVD